MDIYASLSMCKMYVSYTCRKLASYKSAGKLPTECDFGLNFSQIFYVMCRKLASCKMLSWYKFEHYCLYFEQEIT